MSSEVERRLERALSAYAALADRAVGSEPGGAPAAAAPATRWRRWRAPVLVAVATAAVVIAVVITATVGHRPQTIRPAGQPQPSAGAAPAETGAGTPMPYELVTHCGIDEARIGTVYYEADHPLIVGAGNPPPGWSDPVQPGTMTVLDASRAVFRDDRGHEVFFHVRPGATGFRRLCD